MCPRTIIAKSSLPPKRPVSVFRFDKESVKSLCGNYNTPIDGACTYSSLGIESTSLFFCYIYIYLGRLTIVPTCVFIMAFYAAIWAMPVVAPIIAATMVFIVLASVAIGVGASNDFPGIVTFGLVVASAWLAGMTYKRVHVSFNPPQSSRPLGYGRLQYEEVNQPAPVAFPTGAPVSGQSMLPAPVMPKSIIP